MNPTKAGLAATAALATVIAVAVGVSGSDGDAPHRVDARTTDLLSEPCAPGATIRTQVSLPDGFKVASRPALTGDAIGAFDIVDLVQDGHIVTVQAQNTSDTERRFQAVIDYAPEHAP